MPDADPPKYVTWKQKQTGEQRQKYIAGPVFPPHHIHSRIELHKRIGNHKCAKLKYAFTIDPDRIPAKLPSSICKYIHELKPLQCKKTQGGVNHKQAGKQ